MIKDVPDLYKFFPDYEANQLVDRNTCFKYSQLLDSKLWAT